MAVELKVMVQDTPGTLACLEKILGDAPTVGGMLALSEAGINIDSVYVTPHGHIVLGVDDVAGAIQVAAGMAIMAFE